MIDWLVGLWYAHLRRIDLMILWPSLKEAATGHHPTPTDALDCAKAGFAMHAFHDAAWLWLGEDEIIRLIDELQ